VFEGGSMLDDKDEKFPTEKFGTFTRVIVELFDNLSVKFVTERRLRFG
jgi:hypothetical protein